MNQAGEQDDGGDERVIENSGRLHGREFLFSNHGLRKRKKRCDWSSGTVSSKRPLFVAGVSTADCQFVRLRLGVDSNMNMADVSGQEIVTVSLLRTTAT